MNITKQLKEELTKEFEFIVGKNAKVIPLKKGKPIVRSQSPKPKISAKAQLQNLKKSLDIESKQKQIEEYQSLKNRKVFDSPKETSGRSTPEFKNNKSRGITCNQKRKTIRTVFPMRILEAFPFFNSPDIADDIITLLDLYDSTSR